MGQQGNMKCLAEIINEMSPGLPTTSCGKDCHEQSARIQNQLTELGIDKQFSKEELLLLDSDIQRAYKSKQRCEICTKNDRFS